MSQDNEHMICINHIQISCRPRIYLPSCQHIYGGIDWTIYCATIQSKEEGDPIIISQKIPPINIGNTSNHNHISQQIK